MSTKPPEIIYLQWEEYEGEDVTWCIDKINGTDVEYIRKDYYDTFVKFMEEHFTELEEKLGINNASLLDKDLQA